MTFTPSAPSIDETYRLFEQANPVAIEDLPDSRSPVAEALYAQLVDRAFGATGGAVAASPSRRTSLRASRRVLALAAAVAAVAVAVAVVPGRIADRGDVVGVDVLERALAAVSGDPVVHAIVENEDAYVTVVDLASGEETPQANRTEYWYDADRGLLRLRMLIGDHVLREFVHSPAGVFTERGRAEAPAGPPRLPAALDGFATRYRKALERGKARVLGHATVDSRQAVRLQVTLPAHGSGPHGRPSEAAEVLIDSETFRPLRFRLLPTPGVAEGPRPWWRVISIETLARNGAHFAPPKRSPRHVDAQMLSNGEALTLAEAATALGRPAIWAGRSIGGLDFAGVERIVATTTWSDGRTTRNPSLLLTYERSDQPGSPSWLQMTVGHASSETPRFGPLDGQPVPAGELLLTKVEPPAKAPPGEPTMWFGTLERDGLRVNLQSPQRDLVVAAARNLAPIA